MTMIEKAAVSVEAAAVMLSVSRSMCWRMVNEKTIRTVRAGKRVLVPMSAINDFLGVVDDGKK